MINVKRSIYGINEILKIAIVMFMFECLQKLGVVKTISMVIKQNIKKLSIFDNVCTKTLPNWMLRQMH